MSLFLFTRAATTVFVKHMPKKTRWPVAWANGYAISRDDDDNGDLEGISHGISFMTYEIHSGRSLGRSYVKWKTSMGPGLSQGIARICCQDS
jgi:hypothetical protein